MRKILFASTAAVLLSASLGNAAMLLDADDNDRKRVVNTWADQNGTTVIARHGAGFVASAAEIRQYTSTTMANSVSPGFLLHSDENDRKQTENQYAH